MSELSLKERYIKEIVPSMAKELGIKNRFAIPRLEKIIVNMGVGDAVDDIKKLEDASRELAQITGQKPVTTRAKKSIAGFKIRKDMPLGCKVTLRGTRMYEFLERLIHAVLPRIRDFRGVSSRSFDGRGNYSLGLKEQIIFTEIEHDQVKRNQGMDITFVTTADSNDAARKLLTHLGMPFERSEKKEESKLG